MKKSKNKVTKKRRREEKEMGGSRPKSLKIIS